MSHNALRTSPHPSQLVDRRDSSAQYDGKNNNLIQFSDLTSDRVTYALIII
jgi:hypothetical protein